MRILYAAGNRAEAQSQLQILIPYFQKSQHIFKISSYKKYVGNVDINYCLDCLLNITKPTEFSFNGNFIYYTKQVLEYKPDLIISDLELYTSVLAIENNINLWQVSGSALLYYGLPVSYKKQASASKFNLNITNGNKRKRNYIKSILNQSSKKLIISSLCGSQDNLPLINGFEYVPIKNLMENL